MPEVIQSRREGGLARWLAKQQRVGGMLADMEAPSATVPKPSASATPKPTPKPKPAAPAARFTQSDLDRAAANAREAEYRRASQVYDNPASHGRERMALALLSGPGDAKSVIEALNQLPTDVELAKRKAKSSQASAQGIWDKAIRATFPENSSQREPANGDGNARKPGTAQAVWDRAIARTYGKEDGA